MTNIQQELLAIADKLDKDAVLVNLLANEILRAIAERLTIPEDVNKHVTRLRLHGNPQNWEAADAIEALQAENVALLVVVEAAKAYRQRVVNPTVCEEPLRKFCKAVDALTAAKGEKP